MKATRLVFADLPLDYRGLVVMFAPRAIRDAVDEHNVEEIVTAMAGHDLTADQEDYLDLLADLLLKYQQQNYAARRLGSSPVQRLRYLLEQSHTTPSQLARLLGCSQPLVSLMLSGKRALSKANIRKLASHFRLDAAYFL